MKKIEIKHSGKYPDVKWKNKDYSLIVTFGDTCPYCGSDKVRRIDSEFCLMRCEKCDKMFIKDF